MDMYVLKYNTIDQIISSKNYENMQKKNNAQLNSLINF